MRYEAALKLWMSWQAMGDRGYERRVDGLFDLAAEFQVMVRARPGFDLVRAAQGTNVCFRYLIAEERQLDGEQRLRREHQSTVAIRERLAREGRFLVNYATLDGAATFRLVVNNPCTSAEDLEGLLEPIEDHA